MASDLGELVRRAFERIRAHNAGFPLTFDVGMDDFIAVLVAKEEQQPYLEEQQQREAEAASVAREIEKQQRWRGK